MQHIPKSHGLSEERSGSVVEYVLDLASKDRYIYFETCLRHCVCLVLVQPRKKGKCHDMTEILLTGV